MKINGRLATLALFAALAAGCFYPPITTPPTDEQQQTIVPLPYDLAWEAVNKVIAENGFRIQAQDSNEGIIETVAPRFSLHDADCGKIRSVVGTYAAEPEPNASTVYTFGVHPRGKEASLVEVLATFNSPVKVPLHPATDVDCVSHGIQESNLLRQVLAMAKQTHRPTYAKPSDAGGAPPSRASAAPPPGPPPPGQSTVEKSPAYSRPSKFSLGLSGSMLKHSTLPGMPAMPDSPPKLSPPGN
ncbi:MAG TPA: hypothetical protein VEU51_19045 [Candidatus Acidoferrales bacterium]|nr:hypothetical protein [Candidatus Acidoferrales bacterium]